jgi:hypothetical protein
MDNISLERQLSIDVDKLEHVYCIETSKDGQIAYIGPKLTREKARFSCPVIIYDVESRRVIS